MIIALNKPWGVLSQFTKECEHHRCLAEFDLPRQVWPVGRLDADSEGLLLLSDEKKLTHQLLDPRFAHWRSYWAQVEGIISEDALQRLRRGGISIADYRTLPARAMLLEPQPQVPERVPPVRVRKSVPDCWIELALREGKNRQVRKMTAAVGFPTLRLLRVSIGKLRLEDLQLEPGSWCELDSAQKRLIFG